MSSILSSIVQFLYNLINWQYFGILAIVWIIADLVWVTRWSNLIKRVGTLLKKPWIFEKDNNPEEPPLYPRRFLEQLTLSRHQDDEITEHSRASGEVASGGVLNKFITPLSKRVFDSSNPLRSIGYVISLVFFVFFVIADAITIANTLQLIGLVEIAPDSILTRLELALLGGALLTAVVGVWMLIEMSGRGQLINAEELENAQKRLYKLFAVIVTLFSGAVMLALAVQRLISLNYLESTPTMELILSFVLYGLLAINSSLSAALTFTPAASGLIVVLYLLFIIFPAVAFLLDIFGRVVYVVIDVAIWALLTPIIAIPHGIGKIFGIFN